MATRDDDADSRDVDWSTWALVLVPHVRVGNGVRHGGGCCSLGWPSLRSSL